MTVNTQLINIKYLFNTDFKRDKIFLSLKFRDGTVFVTFQLFFRPR